MSWQFNNQQGEWELVDSLGKDLSAILHCPVRYCAWQYDKPIFETADGKVYPKFAVQAAQDSGDWSQVMQHHKESI